MKALVTGGGGYLGRHIAKALLDRGDSVRVVGRHRYTQVEAWGAEGVVADLAADDPALTAACEGIDVVFHAAALPPYHAPEAVFRATNVGGTQRVLDAVKAAGVPRLVFTGTPSATFDGRDVEGGTEASCPYPATFGNPYAATKAEAERRVLAASGPSLATTALRPHLIYGPEEPHMLPRVIARHREGRLRVIGNGQNRVGLTFIDTAAQAHLQAADALAVGSANAGRAYFITDDEPVALWPWLGRFLEATGHPPLTGQVSLGLARAVGGLCEAAWTWLPLQGEPPMTRFAATNLATSHWYDLTAARSDFGFRAAATGDEAFERTVAWFREHALR